MGAKRTTHRTFRRTRYVAGGIMVQTADGVAYTWTGRLWVWRWIAPDCRLQRDLARPPASPSWLAIAYPGCLTSAVRYSLAWEAGYMAGREGGAG